MNHHAAITDHVLHVSRNYSATGREYNLSRERVRQIVQKSHPGWTPRKPKPPTQPRPVCQLCSRKVPKGRRKFCCEAHQRAWKVFLDKTVWRTRLARSRAKHGTTPAQRRWGRERMLKGFGPPVVRRGSKAYEALKQVGLLDGFRISE